ncbi:ABC transporter permease [Chloroflexota bacterium]
MSIRRVGILLSKEFLYGPKNFIFIFAVVAPILISVVLSLVFGTLFANQPKLGIYDEGVSQLPALAADAGAVDTTEYASAEALRAAVERGTVDTGVILPAGFDEALKQGTDTGLTTYIWGESLASSRTIAGVTLSNLVRDISGVETPVEIEVISLGGEAGIPWNDRMLPLVVLMAVFIGGLMLPATSLITEKEKHTLSAVSVTPASIMDILISKGILGVILSIIMGVLILVINQAFGAQPVLLVLVLLLGGIMAAELGLLLGILLKDFNTLFAVWKSGGILLFGPVFIYLFPQIPSWIGRIFPTYYIIQPIVDISQRGGGWAEIALNTFILIGLNVVLMAVVWLTQQRKMQYAL